MKRKFTKSIGLVIIIIMIVTLFAGCAQPTSTTPGATTTGTTGGTTATKTAVLKIGVSDAQTGTGAVYGLPGARGVEIAAKMCNAEGGFQIGDTLYTIELVSYDNKADATESVNVLRKLVDENNVKYILGYSSSPPTLAAVQAANGMDVTLICGNARAPDLLLYTEGNAFRTCTPNCYDVTDYAKFVEEIGVTKMAFFTQTADSNTKFHSQQLTDALKLLNIDTVTVQESKAGETNFLTQATAIINSGADAYYSVSYLGESAWCLRQMRELGSKMPHFTYAGGSAAQWLEICTNEQMKDSYNLRPSCAYDYLGIRDTADNFNNEYKAVFNMDAPQTSTFTFDNFWILLSAMKKAGSIERADVEKALLEMTLADLDKHVIMTYTPVDGKMFDVRGQAWAGMSGLVWDMEKQDWKLLKELSPGDPEYANLFIDNLAKEKGIPTRR